MSIKNKMIITTASIAVLSLMVVFTVSIVWDIRTFDEDMHTIYSALINNNNNSIFQILDRAKNNNLVYSEMNKLKLSIDENNINDDNNLGAVSSNFYSRGGINEYATGAGIYFNPNNIGIANSKYANGYFVYSYDNNLGGVSTDTSYDGNAYNHLMGELFAGEIPNVNINVDMSRVYYSTAYSKSIGRTNSDVITVASAIYNQFGILALNVVDISISKLKNLIDNNISESDNTLHVILVNFNDNQIVYHEEGSHILANMNSIAWVRDLIYRFSTTENIFLNDVDINGSPNDVYIDYLGIAGFYSISYALSNVYSFDIISRLILYILVLIGAVVGIILTTSILTYYILKPLESITNIMVHTSSEKDLRYKFSSLKTKDVIDQMHQWISIFISSMNGAFSRIFGGLSSLKVFSNSLDSASTDLSKNISSSFNDLNVISENVKKNENSIAEVVSIVKSLSDDFINASSSFISIGNIKQDVTGKIDNVNFLLTKLELFW